MIDPTLPGSTHPHSGAPAGPVVLLVEDEDPLRVAIARVLAQSGYRVLEARQGAEALDLLAGGNAPLVELVLTDLRMPIMDGRQLAAALARIRPALPIIFMSGFTAQLMEMRLVSPDLPFLAKPFRNDDLLITVRRHLAPDPAPQQWQKSED